MPFIHYRTSYMYSNSYATGMHIKLYACILYIKGFNMRYQIHMDVLDI